MFIKDQLGNEIRLDSSPKRIISLVPSLTELLYDLDVENHIVGITKFCVHPYSAKQTKEIVGGTKNCKFDKIKFLQPDIILCNKEENTQEIVEKCSQICHVHVSDIYTIDDTKELIYQYGVIFNRRTQANAINQKLDFKLNDFRNYISDKKTIKTAYFIWRNPWMAAGSRTFINHILQLNKFYNIYKHKTRYPEVAIENIRKEGDPELILLSSEPYPFKEEHAFEIGIHTHHAKTVFVNGEMFSWYGTRLLKSFDYFKKLREKL